MLRWPFSHSEFGYQVRWRAQKVQSGVDIRARMFFAGHDKGRRGAIVRIFLAFGLILSVAGCSGGGRGSLAGLNPFNWFSGQNGQGAQVQSLAPGRGYAVDIDTRPLVAQITGLAVERTASGVIVRATALPPSDGYYDAGLVAVAPQNSRELRYEFRARAPTQVIRIGSPFQRQIIAAVHLTRAQLNGIRRIVVVGQGNSRSSRP
jgi:hypothetical protein